MLTHFRQATQFDPVCYNNLLGYSKKIPGAILLSYLIIPDFMTATAHALVGGAIAASIQNPYLGITLSALSHPLLDIIPHWDFGWGWREKTKTKLFIEAVGDLVLGTLLAYILFGRSTELWYFLACVFVSEMWDMAEAPYWFLGWRFPPFNWIYKFQSGMQGKTKTMLGGILTQLATIFLIVTALKAVSF